MEGIIPSGPKTYEVYGDFTSENLVEGKLYYDSDKRLYYYSTHETRSNPSTGYFPIWNGKRIYSSNFSNRKYMDKDVTVTNIETMAANINKDVANDVIYRQRRSMNDTLLKPAICDEDNMFTQCIKGVICAMNIAMVDLVDMSKGKLPEKAIENYYSSLNKITFMRLEKWKIWLSSILHVSYVLDVYDDDKKLVTYHYPEDTFDTGVVKYDNITGQKYDAYKKIVKILMIMKNITKNMLKTDDVDDYTINNMMTTLNGDKSLSAQIFSRFIRMAGLSYTIRIYDGDKLLFEYME